MANNMNSYTIPTDQTAEERHRDRLAFEYETARFNRPSDPTVTVGGRATEYIAGNEAGGRDGQTRDHKAMIAFAEPGLRPGHIVIGGVETTIEAAKAAGIDVAPFDRAAPSNSGGAATKRTEARTTGKRQWGIVLEDQQQRPPQRVIAAGQSASSDGQDDDTSETPDAAHPARKAAVEAASHTVQGIEQIHGSHVVDAGIEVAVNSGELPEELPSGVTSGHIEKIVAGYVASANETLSEVGATVNMLTETLTDDELREARRATVSGDAAKLQHFGTRAVEMLASLPTSDPESFAEMVAAMAPKERALLSQAANGDWLVTLPGKSPMGFGAAVRAGVVRV
jgi:hypothetical protein